MDSQKARKDGYLAKAREADEHGDRFVAGPIREYWRRIAEEYRNLARFT
jgi:muconolactone delta-isomerase